MSSSKKHIIANWKMDQTLEEMFYFLKELEVLLPSSQHKAYIAAPYPLIHPLVEKSRKFNVTIGSQDLSEHDKGAYTGDVSALILKSVGARFTLVGHSERRQYHQEMDLQVSKKLQQGLKYGLEVVLCIGESLEERQQGQTKIVLQRQLERALRGLTVKDLPFIKVAYEPIWAIGTGQTAQVDQVQYLHQFCKDCMLSIFSCEKELLPPVLYGGSVKPENIAYFLEKEVIDGALIGGASLKASSFCRMLKI